MSTHSPPASCPSDALGYRQPLHCTHLAEERELLPTPAVLPFAEPLRKQGRQSNATAVYLWCG